MTVLWAGHTIIWRTDIMVRNFFQILLPIFDKKNSLNKLFNGNLFLGQSSEESDIICESGFCTVTHNTFTKNFMIASMAISRITVSQNSRIVIDV